MNGRIMNRLCGAVAAALLWSASGAVGAEKNEYTAGDFRRISAMTAKILERNHYSGVKINRAMSEKIFDRYFDMLDPARMLFTAADVEKFSGCRQDIGERLLRGECDFAFEVYEVFRRRYGEFRAFTREMLKHEVDFTVDESIAAEPSKQPRPADETAMRDLWRRRVKNDLLLYRMMERAEAAEKDKPSADPGVSPAAPRRASAAKTPAERILQRQRDIGNDVDQRDRIDILGLLLDAMARSFGAHSDYQAPKLSRDFEISMSLSLSGIGATLTSENGYIKIVELVPGGPAALSGKIKVNDRIVTVTQGNGETADLIDMPVSKAVQFIRGEKGSEVVLGILSGEGGAPRSVTLVRDRINLSAGAAKGEVREVEGKSGVIKVGVITLPGFYMDMEAVMRGDADARRASADVRNILRDFERRQVDSVVIDLRKNGGGSLPDAIALSGLFLSGNPVVQVRDKNNLSLERDPDVRMMYSGPLVVLTSKFSASAAEIFSGAMRDSNRAVLVGDSRTFGKGTVLRVESLDRYNSWFGKAQPAGALTFEIAMFYRPSGGSVQQLGIAPDIQLPALTEELEVGEVFLDNHLPWDAIARVENPPFDPDLDRKIGELKKRSEARVAADPRYKALLRRIGQFRAIRTRKRISLNEKVRWDEYVREKQVSEEVEALESESGEAKGAEDRDPVLGEAVNIAADLFSMEKKRL
ncbi:MAG: carboxy terminal-processing peptidase [Lentisphaeria bacterium]|nr:carboxy terminal-processing peptidase [Lentisphaeria bacterium]